MRRQSEQGIRNRRTRVPQQQNRSAANAIRKPPPDRREEELLNENELMIKPISNPCASKSLTVPCKRGRTMPKPIKSINTVRKMTNNEGLRMKNIGPLSSQRNEITQARAA